MMTFALVLFGLATVDGVLLLMHRFDGREMPLILTLTHGAMASVALVLAVMPVVGLLRTGAPVDLFVVAVALLVLAALLGLVLLILHVRKGTFPLPLALVHGIVAVGGLLLLLLWRLTMGGL